MTRTRIKISVIVLGVCLQASVSAAVVLFPGVTGRPLIDSLRTHYKSARILNYAGSPDPRDTLFGEIYLTAAESLECVYSGYTIYMQPGQDPDDWALANDINCEHTWPQSLLNTSQTPNPTGDMHHLFPTRQLVNADRGNSPFAEIADTNTQYWYYRNIQRSTSIPSSNIDGYAEVNLNVGTPGCEPREIQQGNTARAMFYMLTMYQLADTTLSWWTGQKYTLRNWHIIDPADGLEGSRTWLIAAHQQNKPNPFVIDSSLVDRCYFTDSLSVNTSVWFANAALSRSEGAGSCSLHVALADPSPSLATTVQVVLDGGTGTAADVGNYSTQTLTFPAGSSAQQSVILAITDDALVEEAETLVFKLRNASGGDDAAVGVDSACTLTIEDNDRTLLSFSPVWSSRSEGEAPLDITVIIANPSEFAATNADVELSGGTGSAADINNYTTQTVTFPAGSTTPQNGQITITDDALSEGTETLFFKLRNASGGDDAAAGADSAFTLTIIDNEAMPGELLLYEPFDYPAGDSINGIHNWTLHSGTANPIRVVSPGLAYGGYKAKAANACSLTTSGEDCNRAFAAQSSGTAYVSFLVNVDSAQYPGDYFLHLSTSPLSTTYFVGRVYVKRDAAYNLAFGLAKAAEGAKYSDSIYSRETTYLLVLKYQIYSGLQNDSVSLFVIDGDIPTNEPSSPTLGPFGAFSNDPAAVGTMALRQGTAGNAAVLKVDEIKVGTTWYKAPLPVQLSSFTATAAGGSIVLDWRTESENGSYMWIVERSSGPAGGYAELARLPAAGTSATPSDYSWTDRASQIGAIYYYRLGELGLDGRITHYGPISASTGGQMITADLSLGCAPNPFRSSTDIRYQVAQESPVSIAIYNVSGQMVRKLDQGVQRRGFYRLPWDGTNDSGARLSNGVYLYRISIGGRQFGGKAQLIR